MKPAAWAAALSCGALLMPAGVAAQIVADPSAAARQRATVLVAPNQVPLVNIQTPSAGGVSRNVYSQFDVQKNGAILNNSRSTVQTQLGGLVQGNPWMGGSPARLILNEVNSSAPSQLLGYLEVAGSKADLVIANPSGLHINGAGFINAGGVTLSTGMLRLGTDGSLTGFQVRQGNILVDGTGLDASGIDHARLLARAIELNAGVWAPQIQVVTGTNDVSASLNDGVTSVPVAAVPSTPRYALDISTLGGMYAGKIVLVGTEAGLGVNNAGTINTAGGSAGLTLNQAGWLSNSGTIASGNAGQDMQIHARGIANRGTLASQRDVLLADASTPGNIQAGTINSGQINAARQLLVQADHLANRVGGQLTAPRLDVQARQLSNSGGLAQTGAQDLLISAQQLANTGTAARIGSPPAPADQGGSSVDARAPVSLPSTAGDGGSTQVLSTPSAILALAPGQITVQQLDNASGQILANGSIDATTTASLANSGQLQLRTLSATGSVNNSQGALQVQQWQGSQTALVNAGGSLHSASPLNLNAQSLDNTQGRISSASTLAMTSTTLVNDQGRISSRGNAQLRTAGRLSNRGGVIQAGDDPASQARLDIQAGAALDNTGGVLAAANALGMSGASINNTAGSVQGASLSVNAGRVVNDGGQMLAATSTLSLSGGTVSNAAGLFQAASDLELQAQALSGDQGRYIAGGKLALTATPASSGADSSLRLDGARLEAASLKLAADDIISTRRAELAAGGELQLKARHLDNTAGSLSGRRVVLQAQDLVNNAGRIVQLGDQDLALQFDERLDNTAGLIASNASQTGIRTARLLNERGAIRSAGELQVSATQLANSGGTLQTDGGLNLQAQELDNRGGTLQALLTLTAKATGAIDSTGGRVLGNAGVSLSSASLRNDANGEISSAQGGLAINIGAISNRGGSLGAEGAVQISSQSLDNSGGALVARTGALQLHTGSLDNAAGLVQAATGVSIGAGTVSNVAGTISSTGPLDVQAGRLNNSQGSLFSSRQLTLGVGGELLNKGGQIVGKEAVQIASLALDNSAGLVQAATTLDVNTAGQRLTHADAGRLLAGTHLTLAAGDLRNDAGALLAGTNQGPGSITITSGAASNIAGTIAAGEIAMHAQGLDNTGGAIQASGRLALNANESITNASGQILGDQGVRIDGGSLRNEAAGLIGSAQGGLALRTGRLDNPGGTLTAGTNIDIDSDAVTSAAGLMQAARKLNIRARSLDNSGGTLAAGQALSADIGKSLLNAGGQILGNAGVKLQSESLGNARGTVGSSDGDLKISTGVLDNQGGTLAAKGSNTIASRSLDNSNGVVHGATLSVDTQGQLLRNDGGVMLAREGSLDLSSGDASNTSGQIVAAKDSLRLNAGKLNNQGGTLAGAMSAEIASGALDNTQGTVHGGKLSVDTGGHALANDSGKLLTRSGALSIRSGDASNAAGLIQAATSLTLESQALINTQGGKLIADELQAQLASLDNSGGTLQAATLAVTSSGTIVNAAGTLQASRELSIQAKRLDNSAGSLAAGASLSADIDSALLNTGGQILGNAGVTLQSGSLGNARGTVSSSEGGLQITTGALDNQAGTLAARRSNNIASQDLDNTRGTIHGSDLRIVTGGQTLTNDGGELVARTGAVSVQSGDVSNAAGLVQAATRLTLESPNLANTQGGRLTANDLQLHVGKLDNSGGLMQADTLALASTGSIANVGGALQAARDLSIQAQDLDNSAGTLAAGQSLSANIAHALLNTGGQILGNAGVMLKSGSLGNASGTVSASAGNLQINTGVLDNQAGTLAASGGNSITSQRMDSTGGLVHGATLHVDTQGHALRNDGGMMLAREGSLQLSSGTTSNRNGGLMQAASSLNLDTASFSNTAGGRLVATTGLQLKTGDFSNDAGTVRVTGTDAALAIQASASVSNVGGWIQASSDLDMQSRSLDNSGGNVQSAGRLGLEISGDAINSAGKLLGDRGLQMSSGSLRNEAQGLIGTAQGELALRTGELSNRDGTLAAGGGATIVSQGLDNSHGVIQGAALKIATQGQALVNDDGLLAARSDSIRLDAGAIRNQGGGIESAQALRIEAQALANTGQVLAGTEVHLNLGTLDNSGGTIQADSLELQATGSARNLGGTIVGAHDATFAVQSLDNSQGRIQARQMLDVTARSELINSTGQILGNAGVQLRSGTLRNDAQGQIASAQGDLGVETGALDNRAGLLAAEGRMTITSQPLDNREGTIHGASLSLDTQGQALNNNAGALIARTGGLALRTGDASNAAGVMQAAAGLDIQAQGLANTHGGQLLAGTDLTLGARALGNSGGLIQASRDLAMQAQLLDNTEGVVVAGRALGLAVDGAIVNAGGQLLGTTAARLSSANLVNDSRNGTAGVIASTQGNVDLATGTMSNHGGVVSAASALQMSTGALENHGGTLVAVDALRLQAAGIDNRDGKILGATVALSSQAAGGAWAKVDNRGGLVAADRHLLIDAGLIDNRSEGVKTGHIQTTQTSSSLELNTHGQDLLNSGSLNATPDAGIVAMGSLRIDTRGAATDGTLFNANGRISSLGATAIAAGRVVNASGAIVSQDRLDLRGTALSGTGLDNRNGSIQARTELALDLAADLDNRQGLLLAERDLGVRSPSLVDNRGGRMLAGGRLHLADSRIDPAADASSAAPSAAWTQDVRNAGGQLYGGQGLLIAGRGQVDGGSTQSDGDLTLLYGQDYTNTGTLSAAGRLRIVTAGDLVNQGQILGGTGLTAGGRNVDNQAGATLSSGGGTQVSAQAGFVNRGLVDGVVTQLEAGTLQNLGTGLIFGDQLGLQAATLVNAAETVNGIATSATIAARERLDLGVGTLNNSGNASVLSLGDIRVGGALDSAGRATGRATAVNNAGSLIEAGGSISIAAQAVNNTNANLVLRQVQVGTAASGNLIQVPGAMPEDAGLYRETYTDRRLVKPDKLAQFDAAATRAISYTHSRPQDGYDLTLTYDESPSSPRYALFGITPPSPNAPTTRPDPGAYGGFVFEGSPAIFIDPADETRYNRDLALFNTYASATEALQLAIDARYSAMLYGGQSWSQYQFIHNVTQTTSRDEVQSSSPGTIRAGSDIAVIGALNNIDSRVIAGGAITVQGSLNNQATLGTQTARVTGIADAIHWEHHGGPFGGGQERYVDSSTPYATTTTNTFALSSYAFVQHASDAQSISVAGGAGGGQLASQVVHAGLGTAAQERDRSGAANGAGAGPAAVDTRQVSGLSAATGAQVSPSALTGPGKAQPLTENAAPAAGLISASIGSGGAQPPADTSVPAPGNPSSAPAGSNSGRDVAAPGGLGSAATGSIAATPRASMPVGGEVSVHSNGALRDQVTGRDLGQTGSVPVGALATAASTGKVSGTSPGSGQVPGGALPAVTEFPGLGASSSVVHTLSAGRSLPSSSLYRSNPDKPLQPLVETSPQFTDYRQWLSSDYMLQALAIDPATTQQRLGDGFYEQQLLREQVGTLTGRRFLGDYSSDDREYQGLMDAGISFAKAQNLRPGIALTPAQVAALTSDIVWLVAQDITLPDGSHRQALAPQLYVRAQAGDLLADGSLISADSIQIHGDVVTNGGTLAGRRLVRIEADNIVSSGMVSGQAVALSATQDIALQGGTVSAVQSLLLNAGRDLNIASTLNTTDTRTGTAEHGSQASSTQRDRLAGLYVTGDQGLLIANAGRDLTLAAAQISNSGAGGTSALAAGRDLTLATVATSTNLAIRHNADNHVDTRQAHEIGTQINAKGSVSLRAGQDLVARAAQVDAGTALAVVAGRDLSIQAGQASQSIDDRYHYTSSGFLSSSSHTQTNQVSSSTVLGSAFSGGTVAMAAQRDLSAQGSTLAASGDVTLAARNIELGSAQATAKQIQHMASSESGLLFKGSGNSDSLQNQTVNQGSTVTGARITAQAQQDLTLVGSQISGRHDVQLLAGQDLNLLAAQSVQDHDLQQSSKKSGLSMDLMNGISVGSASAAQTGRGGASTVVGSSISGANVVLQSGRDSTLAAATLLADQDIQVNAGRDLSILAVEHSQRSESSAQNRSTSIGLQGGLSARFTLYGQNSAQQDSADQLSAKVTSALSANSGSISLRAGSGAAEPGKVLIQGADLLARDRVSITGSSVDLQAVESTGSSRSHAQSQSVTLGSQLTGAVGGALTQISDMIELSRNTDDKRLQAAAALKAGYDAYKLGASLAGSTGEAAAGAATSASGDSGAAIGVSVSIASSKSRQDSQQAHADVRGTNIQAGSIDINASAGDLSAQAAKLQARDISLQAERDILLSAGANTRSMQSSNKSSSEGGGVTIGVGEQNGISFQLSASQAKGRANGNETVYDNSQLIASQNLRVTSGRDTSLQGAQLGGDKVQLQAGRNLDIQTLQDKTQYESQQSSSGFSVSVCVPPICVGTTVTGSLNIAKQRLSHNYLSATGQSGIAAGAAGFDIQVGGHTDLLGAALTSKADNKSLNRLTTGSLSSTDLDNHQRTDASSMSVGLAYGGSSAVATVAANVASNVLGNLQGSLPADKNDSSQTLSVISPATVSIRSGDPASQTEADKLTRRDASTANQSLSNTFGLQQAQQLQADQKELQDRQQAAQLIGSVITNVIGDVAQKEKWAEGSPQKMVLHGLAGLVQAKVGGSNALAGVAAGVSHEALSGQMHDYLTSQGYDTRTPEKRREFDALMNAGSALLGAAVGSVVGGNSQSAGAAGRIALVADQNNRQLHPSEIHWIKANAKAFADKNPGMTVAQATERLTQQAARQADAVWALTLKGDTDQAAQDFLANQANTFQNELGQQQKLFTVSGDQFYRPGMYAPELAQQQGFVDKYLKPGVAYTPMEGLKLRTADALDKILDNPAAAVKAAGTAAAAIGSAAVDAASDCATSPWRCTKDAAKGIKDGLTSTGRAFGEGVAVAIDDTSRDQLNRIYGQDVSDVQKVLLTARGATAIAGALGAGKAAGAAADLASDAVKAAGTVAKGKLDDVARAKAEAKVIEKAKVDNNFYAEGASSNPVGLQTSAGVIPPNPNKTTTVLGRWNPDMESVVEPQTQALRSEDFGPRSGGFNVLNVGSATEKAAGSAFFQKVNKPFLDEAIKRGDDIALATIPVRISDLVDLRTNTLKGMFAREIEYLVKIDYRPVNISQKQWLMIKGWFN